MRAGGQSSPSPSHLPTDSVRSVYLSYLSWLKGAGETDIWNQISVHGWGLNPNSQTSRLAVQHANRKTAALPKAHDRQRQNARMCVSIYVYNILCICVCIYVCVQASMCVSASHAVSDLSKKKQRGRRSTDVIKFY